MPISTDPVADDFYLNNEGALMAMINPDSVPDYIEEVNP